MTPLIDVMLVLLVIFMITAPLMGRSLKLDLPQSDAAQPNDATISLAVAIDADGALHLDARPIDATALASRVAEAALANPHTEVQLRADRSVAYGRVAEVIGLVHQGGLTRIGFVTEPPRVADPPPAR